MKNNAHPPQRYSHHNTEPVKVISHGKRDFADMITGIDIDIILDYPT